MKPLIEKGADLDSKDDRGQSPLSKASEYGREAVVKLLLGRGMHLDSKDSFGKTPVSKASENGHEAIVRLCSKKKARMWTPKDNFW